MFIGTTLLRYIRFVFLLHHYLWLLLHPLKPLFNPFYLQMMGYISTIQLRFRIHSLILNFLLTHHLSNIIVGLLNKTKTKRIPMRSGSGSNPLLTRFLLNNNLTSQKSWWLFSSFTVFEHRKSLWEYIVKFIILLTFTYLFIHTSCFILPTSQKIIPWVFSTLSAAFLVSCYKLRHLVDETLRLVQFYSSFFDIWRVIFEWKIKKIVFKFLY